jgi:hypothetical protein
MEYNKNTLYILRNGDFLDIIYLPMLAVVGQAFIYLFTKGISDYIHVGYAEQAGDIRT